VDFLNKTVQGNDDKQPDCTKSHSFTWYKLSFACSAEIIHHIFVLENKVNVQLKDSADLMVHSLCSLFSPDSTIKLATVSIKKHFCSM